MFTLKRMSHLWLFLLLAGLGISCDPGEYSNNDGGCIQCDISCNTCSSSDSCDSCYDQMYLMAKGNQIVCQVCYVINKGCDICITATKCTSCQAGYFLQDDNSCFGCGSYLPNCLLCETGNNTYCLSCMANYQLINGECQPYIISSSNFFQSLPIGESFNLAQSSQSSLGPICDPSQVLLNQACYPAIPFCLSYNQWSGSCVSCNSLFLLNNGYCLPPILGTSNINNQAQSFSTITGSITLNLASPESFLSTPPANPGTPSNLGPQNCVIVNSTDSSKCSICGAGYAIVDAIPGICYPVN